MAFNLRARVVRSFQDVQLNFDQLAGLLADRTVRGVVNADGSIAAGSGFTVTKNGTGDYTVSFVPAFSGVPSFVAWPLTGSGASSVNGIAGSPPTAGQARTYITSVGTTPANVDTAFHFVAVGPR